MTTTSFEANAAERDVRGKDGRKGYANAFLDKIIAQGPYRVVWKEALRPGDSTYGIFAGVGMFSTNECESGEAPAIFLCLVKKKKDGTLTRTGKTPGTGKTFFPQFIIPYHYAYQVGEALQMVVGKKEVVEKVEEKKQEVKDNEVDMLMKKLYGRK